MLFASLDYLLFLPPVLAIYWLASKRAALAFGFLLVASYFFYSASPEPAQGALPARWYFCGLLVASTLLDYAAGRWIAAIRERGRRGTALMVLSLVANLSLLGYFKYTGFLLEVAGDLGRVAGLHWAAPAFEVVLPIGISFYTFQSLSYTLDVYRGTLQAERSLLRFALYIAFFPQLVAGPIVRARDFLPQLHAPRCVERADVDQAVYRIGQGLIKKLVFADFIAASFTDAVFSRPGDYSWLENLLALYAFTLQIYADFAGYSDIAIGSARLFGFHLPENFDRPYRATSVGEFWRRWHMTLSSWLRDYLFFPLGGSRGRPLRVYFNIWLTMFLVGMWHGASWNFVIYANLQAAAMVLNRFVRLRTGSAAWRGAQNVLASGVFFALAFLLGQSLGLGERAAWFALGAAGLALSVCLLPDPTRAAWSRPLHVLLTFHFVVLSRVFFRADSLARAKEMIQALLSVDAHWVRPGLFRVQSLYAWFEAASLPAPLRTLGVSFSNWGVAWLLAFGLALHFTPKGALDRLGVGLCARLPAWSVALGLAVVGAAVSQLLNGPRPNIYFVF